MWFTRSSRLAWEGSILYWPAGAGITDPAGGGGVSAAWDSPTKRVAEQRATLMTLRIRSIPGMKPPSLSGAWILDIARSLVQRTVSTDIDIDLSEVESVLEITDRTRTSTCADVRCRRA